MFKVRIKTSPGETNPKSTGQQEDYGLVRNLRGMQNSPEQYAVNDTMGAVPRSEANIEVEGGESVIGDINNDGTMELMHFTGKRHNQGGVPVNIPEGSFIYSDTKNLTIKDPEVIEKIFNLPFRKQGYTPAEISKKYDINMYVEILKDETSDPLAKRSAAEMLKKNKQKLGLLAFIQESMKGFPDGIPAIAEEVLSSMGIDPNQMAQQFAPQQPQQGQMPQGQPQGQMMPPPQEGQGIPMSEDAMQGMMPEGPAVAPEDLANQMSGKFGGVMLPHYEQAGAVSSCPTGFIWSAKAKDCVLPQYKNLDSWKIPPEGFASNWESGSTSVVVPKKKPTVSDINAQKLFDNAFRISTPSKYDNRQKEITEALEAKRQKEGYYKKANELALLTKKIMAGTANSEETKQAALFNEYFLGIKPGGVKTAEREAEDKLVDDIDKKYGTVGLDPTQVQDEIKRKESESSYKDNIPGFGSASALQDYMSENYQQQIAGDTFYKALLTNDPQQMLKAADEIKNIDIPWSIGWMPFTDQDKIDDMYTILHEEALKKINEKQKDIIVTDYGISTIKTKFNDVIKKYEKLRDDATDVTTKLAYAAKLDKFNRYKKRLITDGNYDTFMADVKKSNVKPNSSGWFGFMDYDLGSPIQDADLNMKKSYEFGRPGPGYEPTTVMTILEEITKEHDIINKTNVAINSPLAFKGQTPSRNIGDPDELTPNYPNRGASFEGGNTEGKVKEMYTKLYGEKSSPKDAKGYAKEYKINAVPTSTFVMGTNDDGQLVWFQITEDKAEFVVTNPEWVKTLNAAATIKEGKKVMLAPAKGPVDIIEMLEEENKLNPPVIPEKKSKVVTPGSQGKSKPKYEREDVNDALFDEFFGNKKMKFGGTMQSVGSNVTIGDKIFRYGGLINENGKLRYDRGGSVLPKYRLAGTTSITSDPVKPIQSPETTATKPGFNGGKPFVYYTLTYPGTNGAESTVINVFADAGDKHIISRQNENTGEAINNDVEITRSSYDYINSKDDLNAYEQKVLAEKWNGKEKEYIAFLNSKNQLFTNKKLREDLKAQFDKDIADVNAYTGSSASKKQQFKDMYYAGLKGMSEQDMMDHLLAQEERNARLAAYGLDVFTSGQQADAAGNTTNTITWDFVKNTPGLRDLYDANSGAGAWAEGEKGQAAYISYRRLLTQDPKYKAQNLAEFQEGVGDESIFGIKGHVSGIDKYSTDTTLGQRLGFKANPPPPVEKPGEKNAFFCVEYTDGTKEIKTVSYKEGEPVVTPSGQIGDKTVKTATQYNTSDEATKNCIPDPKIPPGTPPKGQSQTWFAPDIVNYAAATRQIIPNTPPTLRQMAQPISGYDTINPITKIAGTTGLMRQQQDLAMNTMDATTGFAAMAGQGYEQLGKDIGGIEEYNATNIVNPYLTRVGNLATDVDYKNTIFRGKFDQEGAVYQEELAGQRNKKDAQEAFLWGQGFGDVLKDNSLRLAYPNAHHAQRLTPTFAWSGVGRDPLGANTNVSPGGASVAQEDCSAVYTQALEQAKSNTSMDDAAKKAYADTAMKNCMARNNSIANQQNKTQQQQYATGLGNMFGGARFGGAMYTAPGAMEFGGMYYDDNY